MKSFFIFGLRRIKKSTSKAALGIENRIIRLTSETKITFLLLRQNSFDPSTVFLFHVQGTETDVITASFAVTAVPVR